MEIMKQNKHKMRGVRGEEVKLGRGDEGGKGKMSIRRGSL